MIRTLFHPTLLRWAAICWSVIISIGCFWPGHGLPDLTSNRDKYMHLLIFMLFAFLWRLSGWSVNRVLVAGIIYAGLIEIMQALVPVIHRSGEWLDFAADAAGLGIGLLLAHLGTRLIEPRQG